MISFAEQFGENAVWKSMPVDFMKRRAALIGDWFGPLGEPHNPLAAMCNYRDQHSTARLPESTAKEAPAGIFAVSGFDHRPGAWK